MHSLRGVPTLHAPAYQATRRVCLLRQRPPSRARAAAVPQHISTQVSQAAVSWAQHCLTAPLVDQVTGCKVYLFGVCHYAPGQHQQLLEVIQQVQPSCIALDVPPDTLPGVLLPYPAWIQTLLDHAGWLDPAAAVDENTPAAAAAAAASIAAAAHSNGNGSSSHGGAPAAMDAATIRQQRQQQLYRELAALAVPDAKIGRDILDPFECLGCYAAVDYTRSPTHIAVAWQDQGFAPGWELAAAAGAALQQGARLACLDAPLRLQESWVKGLLQKFVVDEQGYAYQPQKDLEALQALVSPDLVTWDAELAAQSAAEATSRAGGAQGDDLPAAAAAAAATSGDGVGKPSTSQLGSREERALVRFKISRATSAAALTVDQTAEALTALRRLQPLKFKHAALRELHMSRQLRDVCCRLATAAGVMPSVVTEVTPASGVGDAPRNSSSSGNSGESAIPGGAGSAGEQPSVGTASTTPYSDNHSSSGQQAGPGRVPVVLAVVGRQYVPGMQALWQQPDSALWRDVMPKDFAPTQLAWELAAQQGAVSERTE